MFTSGCAGSSSLLELSYTCGEGASLVVEHGSRARGLEKLRQVGSEVAAPGLLSTGSGVSIRGLSSSMARGILPGQGLSLYLLQ